MGFWKSARLVTVGTGEGVENGIKFGLLDFRQLVLFLASEESWQKTGSKILEGEDDYVQIRHLTPDEIESALQNGKIPFYVHISNDVKNLEQLYREYTQLISRLQRLNPKVTLSADFTSGTKPMSAALVLASIDRQVDTLQYITGDAGVNGRVISGTERAITARPLRVFLRRLTERSIHAFNQGLFHSARQLLEVVHLSPDHPDAPIMGWLSQMVQAYHAWDLFQHQDALQILTEIRKNHTNFLQTFGLVRKIEKHKSILHKLSVECQDTPCPERFMDLLANAHRRISAGRYDDAVARLYRALEYVAQMKLHQKGLDTSDLDIEKISHPHLKEDLLKYRDRDGKIKVGLYQAYRILEEAFQDPLGEVFMREYKKGPLKKLLSVRNQSILAHGFVPVQKETAEELFTCLVENILPKVQKHSPFQLQDFEFPHLEPGKGLLS